MITGGCHCGRVRFALPALPAEVTRCNCSICAKLGALWAYYPPDALEITRGDDILVSYRWGDALIRRGSAG